MKKQYLLYDDDININKNNKINYQHNYNYHQ